jgi:hypothetical protein
MRLALVAGIAVLVIVLAIGVAVAIGAGAGFGAPGIPHSTQGRSDCLSCHGQGTTNPYPGWHADKKFDDGRCQSCHHTGS